MTILDAAYLIALAVTERPHHDGDGIEEMTEVGPQAAGYNAVPLLWRSVMP